MATDPDYCDIICIGIKEFNKEPVLYNLQDMVAWWEEHTASPMILITFNGKKFDLPVMIKAGIRNKLELPYKALYKSCGKYNSEGHIDLMDVLNFNGNMDTVKSLDAYLKIFCGITKETQGDDFFQNATEEEIKQHCIEDLQYTERLFKRIRRLL